MIQLIQLKEPLLIIGSEEGYDTEGAFHFIELAVYAKLDESGKMHYVNYNDYEFEPRQCAIACPITPKHLGVIAKIFERDAHWFRNHNINDDLKIAFCAAGMSKETWQFLCDKVNGKK